MDPLSVVASVIAISQAFGVGVNALKALTNTSSEFSDMLSELSGLQAWLDQLRLATESLATTEFQISGNLLERLELAKVELSQIVNEMGDIRRKLIKHGKDKMDWNRNGEARVSVITWQRMRGRVQKLRDRAKRCRDELSACLNVVGLSQQVQQQQTSREILDISNTQYLLMQTTFARFEERINALQTTLFQQHPVVDVVGSLSDNKPGPTVSIDQPIMTDQEPSATDVQVPVRQKCSRYCKCQCHKSSSIRNPSWTHALIGSMMLQYNGTIRLDASPCDIPGCQSGKGRQIRVAYSFPSWLIQRAFQLSADWSSLTNICASLYLTVPRVCEPLTIWLALRQDDVEWLHNAIENRLLLPTDISKDGEPYLLYTLMRGYYRCAQLLLKMGFRPDFPHQRTGLSPALYARQLTLKGELPDHNCRDVVSEMIGDQIEDQKVSTLIRDAILQVGPTTLEDALAVEAHFVNAIDDVGYAPLHWAAAHGTPSQIDLLLQYGADIDIKNAYQSSSPLLLAVMEDNAPCVDFLLSRGSNITLTDMDDYGVLHACRSADVMQMLLTEIQDKRFLDAKSASEETALHCVMNKPAASELITMLVQAGADVNGGYTVGKYGTTPLLRAVQLTSVQVATTLYNLGAQVDALDCEGDGILSYTVLWSTSEMIDSLRSFELEGINPEQENVYGQSAMELFRQRMRRPWFPGQKRPTQMDVFSFYALVTEIRHRNWARGLFLETRELLEREGQLGNIRRWLGRKWQDIRDDGDFGDLLWDFEHEVYPEEYLEEELNINYDVVMLFGGDGELPGHCERGMSPISQVYEDDGDMDEFYDALQ
ncbi:Ankyrin repeat-containing domain protein [Naviculisporaceae sp. PSN 640]